MREFKIAPKTVWRQRSCRTRIAVKFDVSNEIWTHTLYNVYIQQVCIRLARRCISNVSLLSSTATVTSMPLSNYCGFGITCS